MKLNKINQLLKKYDKRVDKLQKQINYLIGLIDEGFGINDLEFYYWIIKNKQIELIDRKWYNYEKRIKIHAKNNK